MMLWNTLQSSSTVCCTAHPNCDPLDQKKFLKWEPSLAYIQGLAAQKERFWGCLAISVEQKRAFTQAISKWKLIHFRYICTSCPHCTIQLPPGNVNSQRSHSQLCKGWANIFYGQILIVIFFICGGAQVRRKSPQHVPWQGAESPAHNSLLSLTSPTVL